MNQPLKGGYYATPFAKTNGATAKLPPEDHYSTVGFRTFRPARSPLPL